jgi:hypothetical protein
VASDCHEYLSELVLTKKGGRKEYFSACLSRQFSFQAASGNSFILNNEQGGKAKAKPIIFTAKEPERCRELIRSPAPGFLQLTAENVPGLIFAKSSSFYSAGRIFRPGRRPFRQKIPAGPRPGPAF